jgi:calcium homeostasis ER protein
MLKRMGWEGAGLGSQQQGLQEPVRGGEVRDKMDKYKGVGMEMNTPFDEFRKRKSYVYNQQPPPASQPRH